MSLFCWTQREIFWRMLETEQFWGTIDFHSIFFSYYGSQWCPKTARLQTFFKISSLVFSRTNKLMQVWKYLRVSKLWQNFHFWVSYPFKRRCIHYNDAHPISFSTVYFHLSFFKDTLQDGYFDIILYVYVGTRARRGKFGVSALWGASQGARTYVCWIGLFHIFFCLRV